MVSFTAAQASSFPMQILKRIGLILVWLAGPVFVFAAANKNDPYLISLRGPGNVVLAAASIIAVVILIRGGYWRRGIAGCSFCCGACHLCRCSQRTLRSSCESETFCKPTSRRHEALADTSWWGTRHSPR
jgi:hypothetical protein